MPAWAGVKVPQGAPKTKSGGAHGVGGFFGHLLGDVRDATVGIPTGAVMIGGAIGHDVAHGNFHETSKIGKAMGKAEWQSWSPLFHGDVKGFAKQTYAHPLAPLLDTMALVTGGGSLAGRMAKVIDDANLASKTGKVAALAQYSRGGRIAFNPKTSHILHYDEKLPKGFEDHGPSFSKRLSKNPVVRKRQEAMHALANRISPHSVDVFGIGARYGRMADRDIYGRRAAMMTQIAQFVDAGRKLSGPDAAKYESQALAHSYHTARGFAFRHDITKPIPQGYRVVKEYTGQKNMFKVRAAGFEREMQNFGGRYSFNLKGQSPSTRILKGADLEKAAKVMTRGKATHVLIIPRHELSRFGLEGARSSKALKYLYHKPTTMWKIAILGYRPAFFLNNFVGNHFMYLMANGGAHGVRDYVDALRQVHSERAVTKSITKTAAALKGKSFSDRWFKDQLSNTLADTTIGRTFQRSGSKGTLGGVARTGLFGVTHNATDKLLRRAQIINVMKGDAHVKSLSAAYRAQGLGKTAAFEKASETVLRHDAQTGGHMRRAVSQSVMDVMGDYHSLTKLERGVRNFVPFYSWDRHISRHLAQMVRDRPIKTDIATKIGQQGAEKTKQMLGDIPDFLKGSIPLSVLGLHHDHPGRKGLISTAGLNPYATLADIADTAGALAGKSQGNVDSLATQTNPLISKFIERATGRSLLSGAAVNPKGPMVPGIYADVVKDLPQWKLLQTAIQGTPKPHVNKKTHKSTPFLFEKNFQQYLDQVLGVPVKQLSTARAKDMADMEQHRKKRKKSSSSSSSGGFAGYGTTGTTGVKGG